MYKHYLTNEYGNLNAPVSEELQQAILREIKLSDLPRAVVINSLSTLLGRYSFKFGDDSNSVLEEIMYILGTFYETS